MEDVHAGHCVVSAWPWRPAGCYHLTATRRASPAWGEALPVAGVHEESRGNAASTSIVRASRPRDRRGPCGERRMRRCGGRWLVPAIVLWVLSRVGRARPGHAPSRHVPVIVLWALSLGLALVAPVGVAPRAAAEDAPPPTASLPPPAGELPPDVVYLAETGHYLRGAFLAFWRERGAEGLFGYPLSEEYQATGADGARRTVQLFDKARFELHELPGGAGTTVELGQLGREALGPVPFPRGEPFPETPDREYVAATGHGLGFGFRTYWPANGGLPVFGYPLGEEMAEGPRTVQYFERAP